MFSCYEVSIHYTAIQMANKAPSQAISELYYQLVFHLFPVRKQFKQFLTGNTEVFALLFLIV